jgi:hypothetical protein
MLLMYMAILSRYQYAAAASREYAERFPERHHPGPRHYVSIRERLCWSCEERYERR